MRLHILNGMILISIVIGSEGVYYNGTNAVASCHATNHYGCVIDNECCFYFAEKSSCSGYCTSEMELDPQTFAPKKVNQSCCAPVAKRYKKTVLWCKGEADIPTKKVDPRFPGWYYQEGFQYTVATQCDCVGSDWQNDVRYDSPYGKSTPDLYTPEETEQPEEQFLRDCMKTFEPPGVCFAPYPGLQVPGGFGNAATTADDCLNACLEWWNPSSGDDVPFCVAANFNEVLNACFLIQPSMYIDVSSASPAPQSTVLYHRRMDVCPFVPTGLPVPP